MSMFVYSILTRLLLLLKMYFPISFLVAILSALLFFLVFGWLHLYASHTADVCVCVGLGPYL